MKFEFLYEMNSIESVHSLLAASCDLYFSDVSSGIFTR